MDDGVLANLYTPSFLTDAWKSPEGAYWKVSAFKKAGQPSIDLTCTRWKTHREAFS